MIIQKELKYFFTIVATSILFFYLLFLVFKKYSGLTFQHFLEICTDFASTFFLTGTHYIGLVLAGFVLIITLGLFFRSFFSYLKTKKEMDFFLKKVDFSKYKKLASILLQNRIRSDLVIVVKDNSDIALTIGWLSPKIILSSGIILKLNSRELEAVLLHELYHLKNKHPLLLVLSEILSSSLYLLPILKEITAKMRSILEKEADNFVVDQQKTINYLTSALKIVTPKKQFNFYPTFSKRYDYRLRKSSFLVSSIFILIGILLLKFPIDTHENIMSKNLNTSYTLIC